MLVVSLCWFLDVVIVFLCGGGLKECMECIDIRKTMYMYIFITLGHVEADREFDYVPWVPSQADTNPFYAIYTVWKSKE